MSKRDWSKKRQHHTYPKTIQRQQHRHLIQTKFSNIHISQNIRENTLALDMSKAFDTININTLIDKLTQIRIPNTITKFIANYIKGRKAYTTFRNTTSTQRQFKTGVPQGGVLSSTLINIYASDIPPPLKHTQLNTYADDITIYTTHINLNTAKTHLRPYFNNIQVWTQAYNLILNTENTT